MNVYIETNFILELAFMQEQYESCNDILAQCQENRSQLFLPAFCIAESYTTLVSQIKKRSRLAEELAGEMRQLSRSQPYKGEILQFQGIAGLLTRTSQEEELRLVNSLERIMRIATLIPVEAAIIANATRHRDDYRLEQQDALILSSVLHHLSSIGDVDSCFINKNKRDFDTPDIIQTLTNLRCKLLFNFDTAAHYVQR